MPPQKILFLAADTSAFQPLDLEAEARAIEAKLRSAPQGSAFVLASHFATTPDDLQATLLRERPTIVHFSGHGEGADAERQGLVLHGDAEGEVKIVSGPALGHLFSVVHDRVALVVLNACHSHAQARHVAEVVDFVVGTDGAIRDESARVFAAAFYRGLGFGRTVKAAFDLGVNALKLEGLDDDDLPVLVAREGADPTSATLVEWFDVYVAYADDDRDSARELSTALYQRGFRVFLEQWEVGAGDVIVRRLEEGLRVSQNGIVLISASTVGRWLSEAYIVLLSRVVEQDERGVEKRLIPVLIGDAELPPFLSTRYRVDLRGKAGDAWQAELDQLAKALRGEKPGPQRPGRQCT
jgi:hypothetical protein